jgi:hypothetical protein
MRLSLIRLGGGFGTLNTKIRGITRYHLSPMEQKATANMFTSGFTNLIRRIFQEAPYVAPRKNRVITLIYGLGIIE